MLQSLSNASAGAGVSILVAPSRRDMSLLGYL
jgi:hypothetical protein